MPVLTIERVGVAESHVEALVRISDPAYVRTSVAPDLPARALKLLPGLARHTCECGHPRGFVSEMADTESAHLLEHIAFELMALAGAPRRLKGETAWDFARDGAGVFRVRLGFDDDLVALGALRDGASIVEWLLIGEGDAPAVDEAVARLAAIRTR